MNNQANDPPGKQPKKSAKKKSTKATAAAIAAAAMPSTSSGFSLHQQQPYPMQPAPSSFNFIGNMAGMPATSTVGGLDPNMAQYLHALSSSTNYMLGSSAGGYDPFSVQPMDQSSNADSSMSGMNSATTVEFVPESPQAAPSNLIGDYVEPKDKPSRTSVIKRSNASSDVPAVEKKRPRKDPLLDLMEDDIDLLRCEEPGPSGSFPTMADSRSRFKKITSLLRQISSDDDIEVLEEKNPEPRSPEIEVLAMPAPPPRRPAAPLKTPLKTCGGGCACGGVQPTDASSFPDLDHPKKGGLTCVVPMTWIEQRMMFHYVNTDSFSPQPVAACGFVWQPMLQVELSSRTNFSHAIGVFLSPRTDPSQEWMEWDLKYKYKIQIPSWDKAVPDKVFGWHEVTTDSKSFSRAMGSASMLPLSEVINGTPRKPFVKGGKLHVHIEFEVLEISGLYKKKNWPMRRGTNPMNDLIVTTSEGKQTAAPSQMLAYFSDFFRKMFSGDKQINEIRLKSLTHEEFTDFMAYILPGPFPLTPENIDRITNAAYYLMADDVRADCDFFLCHVGSGVPMTKKAKMAARYDLKQLKIQIMKQTTGSGVPTRMLPYLSSMKKLAHMQWESGIKENVFDSEEESDAANFG